MPQLPSNGIPRNTRRAGHPPPGFIPTAQGMTAPRGLSDGMRRSLLAVGAAALVCVAALASLPGGQPRMHARPEPPARPASARATAAPDHHRNEERPHTATVQVRPAKHNFTPAAPPPVAPRAIFVRHASEVPQSARGTHPTAFSRSSPTWIIRREESIPPASLRPATGPFAVPHHWPVPVVIAAPAIRRSGSFLRVAPVRPLMFTSRSSPRAPQCASIAEQSSSRNSIALPRMERGARFVSPQIFQTDRISVRTAPFQQYEPRCHNDRSQRTPTRNPSRSRSFRP